MVGGKLGENASEAVKEETDGFQLAWQVWMKRGRGELWLVKDVSVRRRVNLKVMEDRLRSWIGRLDVY